MKKKFTVLTAIALCVVMLAGFSACSGTGGGENETEFVAATVPVSEGIPVSKADIVSFCNDIISKVQKADTFTDDNRPGLNSSESLSAGDLKILSYNPETGEATESESLNALNKSAKAIKDRIIGGIDTSIPVVPFGALTKDTINSVIYPADSEEINLAESDVTKAECNVDGNNINIYIELSDSADTIEKVFGIRDKSKVIADINEHSGEYAKLNDYTVKYLNIDEENNTAHSTINLSVEVEKQADGTYKCTGRITTFNINVVADVTAHITCGGSFADSGDIQVSFRLTDSKNYEFDWLGNAEWEPEAESSAE